MDKSSPGPATYRGANDRKNHESDYQISRRNPTNHQKGDTSRGVPCHGEAGGVVGAEDGDVRLERVCQRVQAGGGGEPAGHAGGQLGVDDGHLGGERVVRDGVLAERGWVRVVRDHRKGGHLRAGAGGGGDAHLRKGGGGGGA
eukprot:1194086-Prorocentrum_minimum.AAC.2